MREAVAARGHGVAQMRRTTGALIVAVLVLMVCLPAQIGQSPKQALSPQMYSTLKGDSDKLDSVISDQHMMIVQHARIVEKLIVQHARIVEKLDVLIPIISASTMHLTALDQRVSTLETRFDRHEAGQVTQPTSIAVLETKVDGLVWLARAIAGLVIASLGAGFLWFRRQINEQVRGMVRGGVQHQETITRLEDIAAKSDKAHDAAAKGMELASEGRTEAKRARETLDTVVLRMENGK